MRVFVCLLPSADGACSQAVAGPGPENTGTECPRTGGGSSSWRLRAGRRLRGREHPRRPRWLLPAGLREEEVTYMAARMKGIMAANEAPTRRFGVVLDLPSGDSFLNEVDSEDRRVMVAPTAHPPSLQGRGAGGQRGAAHHHAGGGLIQIRPQAVPGRAWNTQVQ